MRYILLFICSSVIAQQLPPFPDASKVTVRTNQVEQSITLTTNNNQLVLSIPIKKIDVKPEQLVLTWEQTNFTWEVISSTNLTNWSHYSYVTGVTYLYLTNYIKDEQRFFKVRMYSIDGQTFN